MYSSLMSVSICMSSHVESTCGRRWQMSPEALLLGVVENIITKL